MRGEGLLDEQAYRQVRTDQFIDALACLSVTALGLLWIDMGMGDDGNRLVDGLCQVFHTQRLHHDHIRPGIPAAFFHINGRVGGAKQDRQISRVRVVAQQFAPV